MNDDYHIDLEKFSLGRFKDELKDSELIPSRRVLKDDIEKRFQVLENNNVHNLKDLADVLKTPKKAREFSSESGLPEDYLLILRREVNSYTPNPVNLDKFHGVKKETVSKLNSIGIVNTIHLFKRIKTLEDRERLALELEIPPGEIYQG